MVYFKSFYYHLLHHFPIQIFNTLSLSIFNVQQSLFFFKIIRIDSIINRKHNNWFFSPIVVDEEPSLAESKHAKYKLHSTISFGIKTSSQLLRLIRSEPIIIKLYLHIILFIVLIWNFNVLQIHYFVQANR